MQDQRNPTDATKLRCCRCRKLKPASEFHEHPRGNRTEPYLSSWCEECDLAGLATGKPGWRLIFRDSSGRARKLSIAERFESKVLKTDGCWLWQRAKSSSGYGVFGVAWGHSMCAHRFAYEQAVGPIPDGLEIDHLCSNRLCVRPDHLEPVTREENIRRARLRRHAAKQAEHDDER